MMIDRAAVCVLLLAVCAGVRRAGAALVTITGQGLSVHVDPASGGYAVFRVKPSWIFAGSVGRPLADVSSGSGRDKIGSFQSVTFRWAADGPESGEIRAYADRPLVQFILVCRSAQPRPPAAFPTLQPPKGLHLFSYADTNFAPPRFEGCRGGTPWVMFDDAADAAILSPAANFMTAEISSSRTEKRGAEPVATTQPAGREARLTDGPIASGVVPTLRDLPANFAHATVLVFGDGINTAWATWGHALTDLSEKKLPANDADPGLKYLGYWTDNGAGYYYNYDPKLGYTGTLDAVVTKLRAVGIPVGYLQLDSWWYLKSYTGPDGSEGDPYKNKALPRGAWNAYGGLLEYVADKALFPDGLRAFQTKLGLPLVTHNRWVDLKSPYRQKYQISGVAATDPKWWDDIADYLKASGVMTYEQDWLDRIYQYSPAFKTTTTAGDAFMDNMARSTRTRGLTMQYCMGLPRHYLQGSKYDNLTTVRVSDDRYERSRWGPGLYVSQMAASLGEWPWVDTFFSHETPNLLLADLSAGMVGVGDKLDQIDAAKIHKVIRADGVIVKPDTSITPIDATYLNDANGNDAPMIAAAYTNHGPLRTAYVFAYPRSSKQMRLHFRPADLGIRGAATVFDAVNHLATEVPVAGIFQAEFKAIDPRTAWAYYIVAPVTTSGITFLGDQDRFVSLGRQRIAQVHVTHAGVETCVLFAPGETRVTLRGYAPAAPQITATAGGRVEQETYDAATGGFSIAVLAGGAGGSVNVTMLMPEPKR